ncbi:hypothetical protein Alfi_0975 [Alistipes finegoldii DSM 17242]|uniref:Uncharacterized protein n=1 Tax=Alistipes finegoldii (strain DSM 17242 / JCM 16770 / CCUG 46020 / CIP 107999 / KCTC 15236 / AHN 2437) TaxID=679935 RepID=I3YK19_ALIFI|nr:hypothetical protein Alfi_0975 [Alistipes finegoldii DSM 17242]
MPGLTKWFVLYNVFSHMFRFCIDSASMSLAGKSHPVVTVTALRLEALVVMLG